MFAMCYVSFSEKFISKSFNIYMLGPKNAQKLTLQIQRLIGTSNLNLQSINLVEFKFYTSLLLKLVSYSRQFGAQLNQPFREIIVALSKEEKFILKLRNTLFSSIFQFALISLLTWTFIYLLKEMVQFQVSNSSLVIILILQSLGLILFLLSFLPLQKKLLGDFEKAFFILYSLKGLMAVGIPFSKVLIYSDFENFPKSKQFNYSYLRLSELTKQAIAQGVNITNFIQEILEDLWLLQDQAFTKFNQFLQVLKFIFLAMFFLPSYLIVIFDLLNMLGI